jgi:ParB-like chromosome segregation protein Spo0J
MSSRLTIEFRPVTSLSPYARKLRKNGHAVKRMAELLKEYGVRIPILIRSNGEIIDGDLRLKAAIALGYTEVPVIICDDWNEAQVKAFRLAVNRSATWADFDLEVVAVEMRELKALNFDLSLTGLCMANSKLDVNSADWRTLVRLPRWPTSLSCFSI